MFVKPGEYEERGVKIKVHEGQDEQTQCWKLETGGATFFFNEAGALVPAASHSEIKAQLSKFAPQIKAAGEGKHP